MPTVNTWSRNACLRQRSRTHSPRGQFWGGADGPTDLTQREGTLCERRERVRWGRCGEEEEEEKSWWRMREREEWMAESAEVM